PSVTDRLPTRTSGPSSSSMMPAPAESPRTALTGADRFSANASSASSTVSPSTLMPTAEVVAPGAKPTLPEAAVKSLPAVALTLAVAKETDTLLPLGCDSEMANVHPVAPVSPSTTPQSPTDTEGGVSSSTMVPIAVPSATDAPTGFDRNTKNVSLSS